VSELARIEAEQRGALSLIRIHGEVDISNDARVLAAMEEAVPQGAVRIVVDLTHTTYLDSAGLALLLRLGERLQGRRQHLTLVVPVGSPVRAVLELTGLPRVISLQTRLEDALAESAQ
jgi:anti-anti-sigma factor